MGNKNTQRYENATRRAYDAWGRQFALHRRVPWEELTPLAALAKSGDRVLDVGCGFGRLYGLLKDLPAGQAGVSYIGVDQSEEQLKIAREMFPEADFQHVDMEQLPFPDASFDIVYCIAALHHLSTVRRREDAIREMARVVKSGGLIVLTNWNMHGRWARKHRESGKWKQVSEADYLVSLYDARRKLLGERFYHAFTPKELRQLAEDAGLVVTDQYFVQKGERTDAEAWRNIVTIAKK